MGAQRRPHRHELCAMLFKALDLLLQVLDAAVQLLCASVPVTGLASAWRAHIFLLSAGDLLGRQSGRLPRARSFTAHRLAPAPALARTSAPLSLRSRPAFSSVSLALRACRQPLGGQDGTASASSSANQGRFQVLLFGVQLLVERADLAQQRSFVGVLCTWGVTRRREPPLGTHGCSIGDRHGLQARLVVLDARLQLLDLRARAT
jgi:hypothetical protein